MLQIINARIMPMRGETLENGQLLIDGGKIKVVGTRMATPAGTEVLDAGGRLVTPGLVDAHCHIGVENSCISGAMGRDCNECSDPATPQVRAIDSIYPQDSSLREALAAGVTTAVTGPGSGNVIGGTFAAVKLHGMRVDDMVIRQSVAMKVAFGENPKNVYGMKGNLPMTRMGTASILREYLGKARRYMEDMEAGRHPAYDIKLEALVPVLNGEIPLKAHCHRADDIFTAIRIAREFGVKITLDHCTDGSLIAGELAREGLPAIIGPSFNRKSNQEVANKCFGTTAKLYEAGVKIAIMTDAPETPLEYLPLCAGLAVKAGLPEQAAWEAITINAAEITGIANRVGSLEVGKDADIVIWNGNPLRNIQACPEKVLVNGEVVVG